jgi:hypothetical protein
MALRHGCARTLPHARRALDRATNRRGAGPMRRGRAAGGNETVATSPGSVRGVMTPLISRRPPRLRRRVDRLVGPAPILGDAPALVGVADVAARLAPIAHEANDQATADRSAGGDLRRPRRRLRSVEAAIGERCIARVDPRARGATSPALRSPALRSSALRSRVRRSVGFVRSRVKDTAVMRFGRLTRRRSAATATSATAAAARRVFRAVLGRQRLWVEAVGSWGGSSCPRHWRFAGRYPERSHRRGERTENPSFSVPRRFHRPTDEQHGACPRVRPRNFCIFTRASRT